MERQKFDADLIKLAISSPKPGERLDFLDFMVETHLIQDKDIREGVVGQLVPLVSRLPRYDVSAALGSPDEGDRLSAVAYLYARPNPAYLDLLIRAMQTEKQPFIQYWGIQAVGKMLAAPNTRVSEATNQALQQLLSSVDDQNGRSRYNELKRIVQGVEGE